MDGRLRESRKTSRGKIHDLYAKALAIQDSRGDRVVLVTTDLLGLPRSLTSEISEYANKSYGLRRDQILFNSSHTHTGPVVKKLSGGRLRSRRRRNPRSLTTTRIDSKTTC